MQGPAPDKIVLVSYAPEIITGLLAKRLAQLVPQVETVFTESLELAVKAHPEARIVLAMLDPVEAVAMNLATLTARSDQARSDQDTTARSAVEAWIREATPLMKIARQVRRRLWLIDARAMAEGRPQTLVPEPQTSKPVDEDAAKGLTAGPEPLYLALAELSIRSDAKAAELAAEIAALRRGPRGVAVDLDLVDASFDAVRRATVEIGLLRESLRISVGELEASAEALVEVRKDRSEYEVLSARHAALERKLLESEEVRQLREEVLGAELLRTVATLASERLRLEEELRAAREEVERIYASTSWQATAPLRSVSRRFAGR